MTTRQLSFTEEYHYDDDETGISIPVILSYGDKSLRAWAKVDTGAEVCLFSREQGLKLGVPIEQGAPITLSGVSGTVDAFGHELAIQTGGLIFQSTVYFAKYPGLQRNLLGRRGWLRKLKLAVIDYDNSLFLSAYDS